MPVKTKNTRSTKTLHKKRVGQHHTHGKHYLKVYWPYVPMALIVLTGLFLGGPRPSQQQDVLSYATEMSSQTLLDATNQRRVTDRKPALALDSKLSAAAQAKAKDMAARDYWSHNTPDGKEPWFFVQSAGYAYKKAGENLAYGFKDSKETVDGWMNSKTHRDNLLDSSFSQVGFGFINAPSYNGSGKETIVVAMYGQPLPAGDTAAAPATDAGLPNTSIGILADTSQKITWAHKLGGQSLPWLAFASGLLSGMALLFITVKHGFAFKRALIHGEQFILRHPLLDIGMTALVMTGYVLGQTTGFIK